MFNESFVEKSNWLYYIFFTSNFEVAIIKILPSSAILGILWSIAIEEQFYLIWPHLTKHFKKGSFVLLCCLIIVASIIFRFYYRDDYSIIYYHTLSVISDMAIGGLIAYFAFFNNTFLNWVIKRPRYQIILLYVVTFSLIYFKKQLFGYEGIPIVMERVIFGLLFGSILLEQNYCKNSLFKLSKIKILSLLGKYTYGLYMYQFIGIVLALRISKILGTNQTLYGVILLETLLALIFTIIIAVVSYYVLEKRFLKLKDTFSKI
jgi:peptidoglycan/LPS O-acetylase OafA/YrhL